MTLEEAKALIYEWGLVEVIETMQRYLWALQVISEHPSHDPDVDAIREFAERVMEGAPDQPAPWETG